MRESGSYFLSEGRRPLVVAHTRHMEHITQRSDLNIRNEVTQKRKPHFARFKNPTLLLARTHKEVMSSHPNLRTSCCQGLGEEVRW